MSSAEQVAAPRVRAAVALGWGGLAGAVAYAAQRLYEWAVAGPVDPLLVLRDAHVGYHWRASCATWWIGTATAIAWLATARASAADRATHRLGALALPAALALALSMGAFP